MILKKEIEKKALEHEVSRSTIDKDWVLGHFVDAIFSIDSCREALIFKGGTCLRKCYIPDYRFSEDLDFTSINPNFQLDENLLREIMSLVQERTGMQLQTHVVCAESVCKGEATIDWGFSAKAKRNNKTYRSSILTYR